MLTIANQHRQEKWLSSKELLLVLHTGGLNCQYLYGGSQLSIISSVEFLRPSFDHYEDKVHM